MALVVEDDGPGIPESLRHTTTAEGTGIGLALCKKVVEEPGGEITAGRSGLGGARFELRLPAARQAGPRGASATLRPPA